MEEPAHQLRNTFDSVPDLYDKHRPGYPEALIEEIIRFSEITDRGEILEIGCGTGQATRPFAERGYNMTCLDLGPNIAEKARQKFKHRPNVTVITGAFESWSPAHNRYDLVIAATSLHWITPGIRFTKTAQILRSGGTLALFTNNHVAKDEGFFLEVQNIYSRIAPGLCRKKAALAGLPGGETGMDLFEKPVVKFYYWNKRFSSGDYVDHLATFSDHIDLPKSQRDDLFREIRELIDVKYNGIVNKTYKSTLNLFTKTAHKQTQDL